MNFLKTFLAALLAFIVANILLIILFFMMLSGVTAMLSEPVPSVRGGSVLKIDFATGITDSPTTSPIKSVGLGGLQFNDSNTLLEALKAIERASYDDNIEGIFINNTGANVSLANIEELRAALVKFKESGKFIVSYGDVYSQSTYYFGSIADKLYLNPEGGMSWAGISTTSIFFKGLLDKLGVDAQIVRHGTFKAAVEPFMQEKMSPENREQNVVLTNAIWGSMLEDISASRNIDSAVLSNYATELSLTSTTKALEYGMVDGLLYIDQVMDILGTVVNEGTTLAQAEYDVLGAVEPLFIEEQIEEVVESEGESAEEIEVGEERVDAEEPSEVDVLEPSTSSKEIKSPNIVSLSNYIASTKYGTVNRSRNNIAIIYADGQIVDGKSSAGNVGGATVSEKISKARKDKNTKAIILRVNSPGGSALASEVIWRELELAREQMPVIVSMGNMAASGGYYIAAPADVILANRTTITGSIGVFGILFDASSGLRKHLGVTTDVVKTNPSADLGSVFRKMTAYEREVVLSGVQQVYGTFVGHVADGRNLTREYVDEIGGGRVWSGLNALDLGLIDGHGGLIDAIALAADRAGVAGDFKLWEVVDSPTGVEMLLRSLGSEAKIEGKLGELFEQYNYVKTLLESQNTIQARMPYMLYVE